MATRNLYATLIGINDYKNVPILNGCVNDILSIDQILRHYCGENHQDLIYSPKFFLAPEEGDDSILSYQSDNGISFTHDLPTFTNITTLAFDHLRQARDNDICLLYYSGHGSYTSAPPGWTGRNTRQCETLVCMDSRSGARDLIDMEIAFLLHAALDQKPNVHCVVIMDCCHSSDNTRSIQKAIRSDTVKFRKAPPSNRRVTPQEYLGHADGFFNAADGRLNRDMARYVQLSACRNHEKSRDTLRGGLFSLNLHHLLRNGGITQSYNQIIDSLATTVSLSESTQNPTCFARDEEDLNISFLGGTISSYTPGYQVRYIPHGDGTGSWRLMAGSLQGIILSDKADAPTTITILQDPTVTAKVVAVHDFTSDLTGDKLNKLDTKTAFTASVANLGIPKLILAWANPGELPQDARDSIQAAYASKQFTFIELVSDTHPSADYHMQIVEGNRPYQYYLSSPTNDIPLYDATDDPEKFLQQAEQVGKWTSLRNRENPNSNFSADDFEFRFERIEGVENLDDAPASSANEANISTISPNEPQTLFYKNGIGPAFRLSVTLKKSAPHIRCHMEALYLDCLFGGERLSDPILNAVKAGDALQLAIEEDGQYYPEIPLKIEDAYASYNIHTTTNYIQIFVSTKPDLGLERFLQQSLTLSPKYANKPKPLTKSIKQSDWNVFTIPITITRSPGVVELDKASTSFTAFSIQAPSGLQAFATEIKAAQIPRTRSLSLAKGAAIEDPSPAIWGDTLVEDFPFGDTFGTQAGNGVIGIELHPTDKSNPPSLQPGEEIIITPQALLAKTRSVRGDEETIIPFGFDKETGLYFPLGYSDTDGHIHIQHLPSPTATTYAPKAIVTRSVGGSIKMYFKKIIGRKVQELALHHFENGKWHRITDTDEIKSKLDTRSPAHVLPLVVHGIFGDTKSILESLKTDESFASNFPIVLSFDYENLSTTIEKSASQLKQALQDVGLFDVGQGKISIIAHSMGGLVSRWFIEKKGGDAIVTKLVMAGTPNGGSEWGKAGQQIIDGLNLLLTHALNVTGPLQWVISGVGFFIKKLHDPKATLKNMELNSEFISALSSSPLPTHVPYYIVGSDTGLLEGTYQGDDPFFKKLGVVFKNQLLYPGLDKTLFKNQPNDMAVTITSMQMMHEFADDLDTAMKILPGDHISYFSEPDTRNAILAYVTQPAN